MADAARKEKLAAAKKKLKNFQRSGNPSPAPTNRSKQATSGDPQAKSATPKANGSKKATTNGSSTNVTPTKTVQPPQHTSTPKAAEKSHQTNSHGKGPSPHMVNHSTATNSPQPASHRDHGSIPTESTERIQQLSLQINGLLSESSALVNDNNSAHSNTLEALESRNRELASLVDKHVKANEQLSQQLNDMKYANTKLQTSFDAEKRGFDDKLKRELGSLKEQLQVHIQTIGILVAEKTELQSSLTQAQKQSEQRLEELDEYSGRLKASRQRVSDLERSFSSASSGKQKHEQQSKELNKEVDRLKLELYKSNKSNEEFQQQNSELQGKLQKKVSECTKLEDNVIELKGRLEMSELHLQQLQNGSGAPIHDPQTTQQIEALLAEKAQLLTKIQEYEQQFERVSQERDHISQQYQEYIQQITQQSQALQLQINSLLDERQQLQDKQRELEVIIKDMKDNHESVSANASEAAKARQELADKVAKMVMEVGELKHKYETQVADNSQLSRLVMEKEEHIASLELRVGQLSDDQVDKDKLLESIQNDKTALSRAMAQNKELKHQLAELQNGFVKMSNDNMEMLTKYSTEQHVSRELATRLEQQEIELNELREQCEQKEQLLQEMQKYAERLQEHGDKHHPGDMEQQLADFKQSTPLIETLQKELASAQDTINALTNQNGELRSQILQGSTRDINMNTSTEQMETMTASIRQLEMERNQIVTILQEEKQQRQTAEKNLETIQGELAHTTPATLNGDVINKAQFEALQHAMQQLEGKYTKAMRDKADLADKTEQLEHIIMQLQGETDTIAEYITLYQTQRMLLRQRQEEKDDYISRLAREREDQADKLNQLQSLVVQLMNERNIPPHALEQSSVTANHVSHSGLPRRSDGNQIAGKLDSSHLEDWPDYTSSDSDASEVEPIVGGDNSTEDSTPSLAHSTPLHDRSAKSKHHPSHGFPQPSWDDSTTASAQMDPTAQKIMNLLTEIGSSVYMDSADVQSSSFLHCSHCSGKVISV